MNQIDLDGYKVRPKSSVDDDAVFYTIWDVTYGSPKEAWGKAGIVNWALVAAGLAVKSKRDEDVTIPTVLLRQMVADRRMLDRETAITEDRKDGAKSSAKR